MDSKTLLYEIDHFLREREGKTISYSLNMPVYARLEELYRRYSFIKDDVERIKRVSTHLQFEAQEEELGAKLRRLREDIEDFRKYNDELNERIKDLGLKYENWFLLSSILAPIREQIEFYLDKYTKLKEYEDTQLQAKEALEKYEELKKEVKKKFGEDFDRLIKIPGKWANEILEKLKESISLSEDRKTLINQLISKTEALRKRFSEIIEAALKQVSILDLSIELKKLDSERVLTERKIRTLLGGVEPKEDIEKFLKGETVRLVDIRGVPIPTETVSECYKLRRELSSLIRKIEDSKKKTEEEKKIWEEGVKRFLEKEKKVDIETPILETKVGRFYQEQAKETLEICKLIKGEESPFYKDLKACFTVVTEIIYSLASSIEYSFSKILFGLFSEFGPSEKTKESVGTLFYSLTGRTIGDILKEEIESLKKKKTITNEDIIDLGVDTVNKIFKILSEKLKASPEMQEKLFKGLRENMYSKIKELVGSEVAAEIDKRLMKLTSLNIKLSKISIKDFFNKVKEAFSKIVEAVKEILSKWNSVKKKLLETLEGLSSENKEIEKGIKKLESLEI